MPSSWAFTVPVGPGKNSTYGLGRYGRPYLTDEALMWRGQVNAQLAGEPLLQGLVFVVIDICKRDDLPEWDLDHHVSPVLDAITRAGGWKDDDQVEGLTALRRRPRDDEPESITVYAWEMTPEDWAWLGESIDG